MHAKMVAIILTSLVVVAHCHCRTSDGGTAADGRDSGESVDPQVGAEKEDRLAVMPDQTAQLPTLP